MRAGARSHCRGCFGTRMRRKQRPLLRWTRHLGCISTDDKSAQMFVTTAPLICPAAAVCIALHYTHQTRETLQAKHTLGLEEGRGIIVSASFVED